MDIDILLHFLVYVDTETYAYTQEYNIFCGRDIFIQRIFKFSQKKFLIHIVETRILFDSRRPGWRESSRESDSQIRVGFDSL